MVKLPWRRSSSADPDDWDDWDDEFDTDTDGPVDTDGAVGTDAEGAVDGADAGVDDPIVSCQFQDGTLTVYEDRLEIERASRSKFDDKVIAMNQVRGVRYKERLVIHYIQIEQRDFENDGEGFLSTPVDENTLHFGGGMRECAREARDAIRERTGTTETVE